MYKPTVNYEDDGVLNRFDLGEWADNEGGLVDLFFSHGVNDDELDQDDIELIEAVQDFRLRYMLFGPALEQLSQLTDKWS